MYHRVTAGIYDPWGLAVSPSNFASQLAMLRQRATPIGLDDLVVARARRAIPRRAVVVTFDDGYADNFEVALPIAAQREIPITLFATTDLVAQQSEAWWDQLCALIIEAPKLPAQLELNLRGTRHQWQVPELTPADRFPQVNQLRPWLAPTGSRLAFYYQLWQALRPLGVPERSLAMEQITAWAERPLPNRRSHRFLTPAELQTFARHPLVTIGGHTTSHPNLASLTREQARIEIQDNLDWLTTVIGVRPRHFAYPFGERSAQTVATVRELGLSSACTTVVDTVHARSALHELPRHAVDDISGEQLQRRLSDLGA